MSSWVVAALTFVFGETVVPGLSMFEAGSLSFSISESPLSRFVIEPPTAREEQVRRIINAQDSRGTRAAESETRKYLPEMVNSNEWLFVGVH